MTDMLGYSTISVNNGLFRASYKMQQRHLIRQVQLDEWDVSFIKYCPLDQVDGYLVKQIT